MSDQASTFRLHRAYLHDLLEGSSARRLFLPRELELAYQEYHYSDAAAHLRAYWPAVVAAITVLGAALFLFDMVSPGRRELVMFAMLAFYVLAAVVVVSAYVPALRPRLKWMVGLSAATALYGIQLDTVLSPSPNYSMYSIPQLGVVLVTIATFTISNLLVRPALCFVLLAKGLFVATMHFGDFAFDWRPYAIYALGATMLGFIIGFAQEVRERTMFLQGRLLLLEKRATDEMAVELEQLSRTDALTGLVNRRHFEEAFGREWSGCLRDGQPVGLLFIDVDHFKTYNDRYGHPAGDACLVRVAQVLQAQASRPADVMARFGGEEFVGLFPRTDPEGLAVIAGRLIESIDAMALVHEGSTTARHVTVSIGVAARIPRPGETPAALLQEADEALYRAKQGGRHRYERAWVIGPQG